MATKAKKAPAKTTKKPAAKKPVSAKAASKSTTKKVATKKSSVSANVKAADAPKEKSTNAVTTKTSVQRKELTPLEKVRSLHFSSFISYLLLAVLSVFLIGSATSEVVLNYMARDSFLSSNSVILGSASEILFSVEYRYILVAALAIGAIGSLLIATKLRRRYENGLAVGISGLRWLLFGITTAILVELASLMAGVQDLMTLKVVAALVLAGALFGWLAERENQNNPNATRKLAWYASLLAYLAAFLPLIGSMVGTFVYGSERFSWYVYAFAAVTFIGVIGVAMIQHSSFKNKAKLNYLVFEQRYLRLDQMVKFLSVLILLAAIN